MDREQQQQQQEQEDRVQRAVYAFGRGELVVVMDDADREDEGDLILSGAHATTELVVEMVARTGGILCVAVAPSVARRLELVPMVPLECSGDPNQTPFTISVDAADATTGASAKERATVARLLADTKTGPKDLRRPGHVFPLVGQAGGLATDYWLQDDRAGRQAIGHGG